MALKTHLALAISHSEFTLRLLALLTLLMVSLTIHSKHVQAVEPSYDHDCQFSSYNDPTSLKEEQERLKPFIGKTYLVKADAGEDKSYQYTISICKKMTDPNIDNKEAAVVQQALNNGQPEGQVYVLGLLNNTHVTLGTDWIMLDYQGGEKYGTHCSKEEKHSVIMITCDETASDGDAKIRFIKEENQKQDNCYYLFELQHKAACPKASSGGLSIGSIFVIVFFVVAAVYLLVGFLYSRFVLHSKGMEQIPNYEFWKDFGNLQADGCDLVCRTKESRRSGGFGGIGDDQLDHEEVRDDNLLPM